MGPSGGVGGSHLTRPRVLELSSVLTAVRYNTQIPEKANKTEHRRHNTTFTAGNTFPPIETTRLSKNGRPFFRLESHCLPQTRLL